MARRIPRWTRTLRRQGERLARDEAGVALVEFALVLPMMLLVFAVIVEGSRMMIGYQSAIAGVRDATRYLARVVPVDICTTGAGVTAYATQLQTIVAQSLTGGTIYPGGVTVRANGVTPALACVAGSYRVNPAPVVTVTALVDITFPFAGIFTLVGSSVGATPLTTSVADQSRVFGS